MKKLLELDRDVVQIIAIEAINEGTVFKLKAQQILTDHAKKIKSLTIKKNG